MSRKFNLITVLFIFYFAFATFAFSSPSLKTTDHLFKYQSQITGINGDVLQNVQSRLDIEQASFGEQLSVESIQKLYNHTPEIIQKAMQPYGYFKSVVHAQLQKTNTGYVAKFVVNSGPVIKLNAIHVLILGEGKDDAKLNALKNNFPLQLHKNFNAETYEAAKNKLILIANEQGYIKAHFAESKVLIDLKQYQVKIILHLNTGKRYYVGNIKLSSNAYDQQFLKRFTKGKENKPFSSQKLTTLQQSLSNSYYFQEAYVTPDFDHIEDYHVPINVNLVPPKAKRYSIGVGYGTLTGPRLTASMDLRRVTTVGHHFETQVKLSEVLSGVSAKYYIPGRNPLTDEWMISGNYQKFSPDNGLSYSKTFTAAYNNKWHHFRNNVGINYLLETFKVENEPNKTSTLLYPKINIYYVNADDLINPHQGTAFDLMVQGAHKSLFSSVSFLQAQLKGKYILRLTDYNRFILRGDMGYTAVKDIVDLPLTMRFFAGGLNTVRGYKDSSIGPGRYLKAFSIEYQNRIIENWNGAIFYDAATAANHFNAPFKKSQGIGIIYESMIGPIKLYVAHANDRVNGSRQKSYGIEFSIGPEF